MRGQFLIVWRRIAYNGVNWSVFFYCPDDSIHNSPLWFIHFALSAPAYRTELFIFPFTHPAHWETFASSKNWCWWMSLGYVPGSSTEMKLLASWIILSNIKDHKWKMSRTSTLSRIMMLLCERDRREIFPSNSNLKFSLHSQNPPCSQFLRREQKEEEKT